MLQDEKFLCQCREDANEFRHEGLGRILCAERGGSNLWDGGEGVAGQVNPCEIPKIHHYFAENSLKAVMNGNTLTHTWSTHSQGWMQCDSDEGEEGMIMSGTHRTDSGSTGSYC